MSIYIEESDTKTAATRCLLILRRATSPWMIWSCGDAGYQLAPSSSRDAERIRKYWPETIAGYFNAEAGSEALMFAMRSAKTNQQIRDFGRTDERRAWEAGYKRMRREMGLAA